MQALVESYLKVDQDKKEKVGIEWTPLIIASATGDIKRVKGVLENGAEVDLQENDGWTALMSASQNGHTEIIELLNKFGAQVDLQKNDGWTALMSASQNGHAEVVTLLHEYGAQVNLPNNDGWTALMLSSQNGHTKVVKLLNEFDAQVNLQKNDGWTALMSASQNGQAEVVKLLHEYGAQVNLPNNDGVTALMLASQNGHTEVVKLLHEYGAQVDLQFNGQKQKQEAGTELTALMITSAAEDIKRVERDLEDSTALEITKITSELDTISVSVKPEKEKDKPIINVQPDQNGLTKHDNDLSRSTVGLSNEEEKSIAHTSDLKVKCEYDIFTTDVNAEKETHHENDEVSNIDGSNYNIIMIDERYDHNSKIEESDCTTHHNVAGVDQPEEDEEMDILLAEYNEHAIPTSIETLGCATELYIALSSEENFEFKTNGGSAEKENYCEVVESSSNRGSLNFDSKSIPVIDKLNNDKSKNKIIDEEQISVEALNSENEQSVAQNCERELDSKTGAEKELCYKVIESSSIQTSLDNSNAVHGNSENSIIKQTHEEAISSQEERLGDTRMNQITDLEQNISDIEIGSTNSKLSIILLSCFMYVIVIFTILGVLYLVGMNILVKRGSGQRCQLGK